MVHSFKAIKRQQVFQIMKATEKQTIRESGCPGYLCARELAREFFDAETLLGDALELAGVPRRSTA